jgi:hypothetical protein
MIITFMNNASDYFQNMMITVRICIQIDNQGLIGRGHNRGGRAKNPVNQIDLLTGYSL